MALPPSIGKALTADMGSKGLVSPSPAPADDEAPPDSDAGDERDVPTILDEIDKLVPGLGDLVSELVDRMREEDEAQDAGG
jgi:hypothetical protein